MRTVVLVVTFGLISMADVTGEPTGHRAGPDHNVAPSAHLPCPTGSERARSMVENFLTNPALSDARSEKGTTSMILDEVQIIQNKFVCQKLHKKKYKNIAQSNVK
jgi:hypothetical protein